MARKCEESQATSAVLALLMYNMAAGLLTGVTCHEIAKAAQTDNKKAREGYEFPELDRLADIRHRKNLSPHSIGLCAGVSMQCMKAHGQLMIGGG